jgi:hypothetical protein
MAYWRQAETACRDICRSAPQVGGGGAGVRGELLFTRGEGCQPISTKVNEELLGQISTKVNEELLGQISTKVIEELLGQISTKVIEELLGQISIKVNEELLVEETQV